MTGFERPSHRILHFLSEIFNVLLQAFEHGEQIPEIFVGLLSILEGRGNIVTEFSERRGEAPSDNDADATDMIKLYQTAAMIYLLRALESISGELRSVQYFMDDAFSSYAGCAHANFNFHC